MASPQVTKLWKVESTNGFGAMQFHEAVPIPALGDHEVLVKIEAVSLNYRDLMIPQGLYPFPLELPIIPCSDGAGKVVATGKFAKRFSPGDSVVTLINQGYQAGTMDEHSLATGLGGSLDGTLREYAAFPEYGLAPAPSNLSYGEAATLCCAGLVVWNALFGLSGKRIKQGDWVLTQGTGGVSTFALRLAKAAGARVVATTSNADKAKQLRSLGADHVINYREIKEWGAEAKRITGGYGFDHIVEVAGPVSIQQSLNAIAIGGVISIVGAVGSMSEKQPNVLDIWNHGCIVRGILVGSKVDLEDLVKAVEANGKELRPVVDRKIFKGIEKARDAYEYQWSGQHQGNVVIEI